ncbi:MAG: phosphoribosylanthranilate isomerase [Candidatus Bathyarchaeia archaeon]
MKVKICGMKRREDVVTACYEGADAVGFIVGAVYRTNDEVSVAEVEQLKRWVPSFVTPVLVTHFTTPEAIVAIAEEVRIKTLQLHGDVSPEGIIRVRRKLPDCTIIKAVHVVDERAVEVAKEYSKVADIILLDSRTTDRIGGTGVVHDWSISARIVRELDIPVILAGGLTPDNVASAIRVVKPYGVDVNTGTKGANGYKDPEKIRAFIRNARGINHRCYTH